MPNVETGHRVDIEQAVQAAVANMLEDPDGREVETERDDLLAVIYCWRDEALADARRARRPDAADRHGPACSLRDTDEMPSERRCTCGADVAYGPDRRVFMDEVEKLREVAQRAAWEAAAKAPIRNRNEAAFVAHLLSDMDVLRPAVDAALDVVLQPGREAGDGRG